MSYNTWHEYGYGIIVDDIPTPTKENILKILDMAPNTKLHFTKALDSWEKDPDYVIPQDDTEFFDDICQYYEGVNCDYGFGALLREIIMEVDGIEFLVCTDYNDKQYLIYTPTYPWYLPTRERDFTMGTIEDVLNKYLTILTDKHIKIDYQECENGG